MQNSKTKVEPNLKDLLDLFKTDLLISFNCHAIAQVTKFNSAEQTCEAQMLYKKSYSVRQSDGTYKIVLKDYPLLIDVPFLILGGGTSHLTFPSSSIVGSDVLILFNDRDLNNWFAGATGKEVASNRLHSFSDGIAIGGLRSLQNSVVGYDEDKVVLAHQGTKLKLGEKFEMSNDVASVFDALDQTLGALQTLLTTMATATPATVVATVATPSGVALTSIIAARTLLSEVME